MGHKKSRRHSGGSKGGVPVDPSDIVILVAGLYGVGKSTFIRNCVQTDSTPENVRLPAVESSIVNPSPQLAVTAAAYPIPDAARAGLLIPSPANRRVVLVETLGFDHEEICTSRAQKMICDWIRDNGVKVAGIIYLAESRFCSPVESNVDALIRWFDSVLPGSQTNALNVVLGIVSPQQGTISDNQVTRLENHWRSLTERWGEDGHGRMEIGVREDDREKALRMVQLLVDRASEGVPATPMPPSRMEQSEEDTHDPKCCGLF
ncbi:hypothetical protein CC1G_12164 [Coprinopsis cinerea okayama7|uniref:G domain-containing protein n=1 Tax=Coprinopsis cinerea (strain Okayama-7 / 130 / ATCC MYA-4618 / FGSC 9003) TaxID=240176 RepID=A8N0C6_COPC7|nr:hypothetical protein CC1G_12164 [Coprinopsis cinerea okayama7\|eukprot:XP_001828323.2 hypothetical protein CC1G_12164 [Coprinopsis cinerea okayama7\